MNFALQGWSGVASAVEGRGPALLIYVPLVLLGAMRSDMKLMPAGGALIRLANWLVLFLLTSMPGGFNALLLVVVKGWLAKTLHNIWLILCEIARLRLPQEHNSELDATSGAGVMLAYGAVIAPGHAGVLIAGAQFQRVIA